MNEHGRNDRDILRYTDVEYTPEGYENVYRWDDFLEIAGGDARYAAMLINRTVAGEPEEGLHPETLVDQDIRDGEAFMLAGRPIVPEDVYDLPRTVHGLYSELVDNVGRSGTLLRDWRGFSAGADADDVLREIEGAFGETEDSRAGTVLGAYADDTFMSPIYAAEDAARDVTPLTPWEDEDGVAFLSRTLDADASARLRFRDRPARHLVHDDGTRARRVEVRPHRPVHSAGLFRILQSLRRAHRVFREETQGRRRGEARSRRTGSPRLSRGQLDRRRPCARRRN